MSEKAAEDTKSSVGAAEVERSGRKRRLCEQHSKECKWLCSSCETDICDVCVVQHQTHGLVDHQTVDDTRERSGGAQMESIRRTQLEENERKTVELLDGLQREFEWAESLLRDTRTELVAKALRDAQLQCRGKKDRAERPSLRRNQLLTAECREMYLELLEKEIKNRRLSILEGIFLYKVVLKPVLVKVLERIKSPEDGSSRISKRLAS